MSRAQKIVAMALQPPDESNFQGCGVFKVNHDGTLSPMSANLSSDALLNDETDTKNEIQLAAKIGNSGQTMPQEQMMDTDSEIQFLFPITPDVGLENKNYNRTSCLLESDVAMHDESFISLTSAIIDTSSIFNKVFLSSTDTEMCNNEIVTENLIKDLGVTTEELNIGSQITVESNEELNNVESAKASPQKEVNDTLEGVSPHCSRLENCNMVDPDYMPPSMEEEVAVHEGKLTISKQRRKRHQVKSSSWKINKSKTARKLGQKYKGKRKLDGYWCYDIQRNEKSIKPRCNCIRKKNSSNMCFSLTESDREHNFKEYWALEWGEKKYFVRLLTEMNPTKRHRDRKDASTSRRTFSCKYFLKRGSEKIRVCKKMFLNTLSIGEWTALNWQKDSEKEIKTQDNDEERNVPQLHSFRKPEGRKSLEEFLSKLSKVESHYCRASSSKQYLEPMWTSKIQLYKFYKDDWCISREVEPLSSCTFSQVFEEHNLSLYTPKKDECDLCAAFKAGNLSQDQYEIHQQKKKEAREEKDSDKVSEECVYTMDLQSLLLCPRSNVSSLYYKTKLAVHNFTVFDLKTHDGYCFLWNETEGGLTANEFSTLITGFVRSQLPLPENANKLILYSDGCCYQNRNTTLSNALLHIAMTNNVVIEQKYLEKGHTQMEADSMHATIERQLKHKTINVPADYVHACKNARKNPRPYVVKYVNHEYFRRFDQHHLYSNIRPGRKPGEPTVTDLKALRYCPNGNILYKLKFSDDWTLLPNRIRKNQSAMAFESFPRLYKERLKVKKLKFEHLQSLKATMEVDFHSFYDNIPFDE